MEQELRWVIAHTMSSRHGHLVVHHGYWRGELVRVFTEWLPPDPPPIPAEPARFAA